MTPDHTLDLLLELDGQVLVVDPQGRHWVRVVVTAVLASEVKPHGLDYSLTLHGPDGERLVGYDNAHSISVGSGPGREKPAAHDHRHRLRRVQPYHYRDAASLLADFWTDVRAVLQERGVSI